MFISENFIYLELHKTGSTHIQNILNNSFDGELVGKHNQVSPDLSTEGRVFIGSVRDPWAWYTSLWAYGCDKRGAVFENVTRESKSIRGLGWRSNPYTAFLKLLHASNHQKWSDTYVDVNDAEAFRAWLQMMHDTKYLADIGEGYGECSVGRIVGLMTFRYLKLFCTKLGENRNLDKLLTLEQVKNYEKENCFIDHFIRNENLESDLFKCIESLDMTYPTNFKQEISLLPRTNTSSRKHRQEYYYDIESENLVAESEQLIIGKFGYVPPSRRVMA